MLSSIYYHTEVSVLPKVEVWFNGLMKGVKQVADPGDPTKDDLVVQALASWPRGRGFDSRNRQLSSMWVQHSKKLGGCTLVVKYLVEQKIALAVLHWSNAG